MIFLIYGIGGDTMSKSVKQHYQWLQKEIKEGKCKVETLPPFVLGAIGAIAKKEGNTEILRLLKAYRMVLKQSKEKKK